MADLNMLFQVLDANDSDDLNLSTISAQESGDVVIEDCCCCCCCG